MSQSSYKVIFFGTPEFASLILERLAKSEFKPLLAVTAPDKPAGRRQVLSPSPVKKTALKHKINLLQPAFLTNNPDIINQLSSFKPDLFILAAYGLILPKEILGIPKHGSLNIHPSLLPKYRGASPIQEAILNGDKKTGISIILMDEKIDHGPIISDSRFQISDLKITSPILSDKLANLGGQLLIETLPKWLAGKIKPVPQDHSKAIFTKKITKEDGKIDWRKSADEIERMVRAYQPWPGAFTTIKLGLSNLNSKKLKIIKSEVLDIKHGKKPGAIFLRENLPPSGGGKELGVTCQKNVLILKQIQLEGKEPTTGQSFLNGYPEITKAVLR